MPSVTLKSFRHFSGLLQALENTLATWMVWTVATRVAIILFDL
jgi:hypothetical protein